MSRYIDIDKAIPIAIQAVVDVVGHGISQVDAVNIADKFEEAPTADVVEVVRCKDCVHSCECELPMVPKEVLWCNKLVSLAHEKHFCSYGERRENGK